MSMSSAQVIAHRTSRVANAGPVPGPAVQRELVGMAQEKVDAFRKSAQAMGPAIVSLNMQLARLMFKQMLSASAAWTSIAASRNATESASRQSKFARETTARAADATSKLSVSVAQVARKAIKPVHTRVRKNVKRLSKR